MREWPGTDSVEEPFVLGFGFPAAPEHLSTLAALGKIFKRSSFQPFRTAGNLTIHEPPAFRLYQEYVETLARAGGRFRTLGAPFSHVADSGLWTMLRCGPWPSLASIACYPWQQLSMLGREMFVKSYSPSAGESGRRAVACCAKS
jgi:hypothetical protein